MASHIVCNGWKPSFPAVSQLQENALQTITRSSAKAGEAAQRAALAEALLLWGRPLLRLRPLAQAAELVAGGHLERLARGAPLLPAAGAFWPCIQQDITALSVACSQGAAQNVSCFAYGCAP